MKQQILVAFQKVEDLVHFLDDGNFLALDFPDDIVGKLFKNALKGPQEVDEIHIKDSFLVRRGPLRGLAGFSFNPHASVNIALRQLTHAEPLGRLFKLLVLKQAGGQFAAGVLSFTFFSGELLHRKKHPALDDHKLSGHDQKVPGDVKIQPLHLVERGHIIPRQIGDGNIVNIDLTFPDQEKKQVQRAFKDFQIDLNQGGP